MPAYLIFAGDPEAPDAVKIGWADEDVQQRRRDLQCATWHTLTIARVIYGTPPTERWLHRYFHKFHIAREWYRFDPEMLTVEPPAVAARGDHGVALIRAQRGAQVCIALALGITRSAVSQWETVPAEYVVTIERITGIPRDQLRPDLFEGWTPTASVAAA
jgi:Putative antitoxin of bacterial toxin-antitoxin system, YdaS/YdaT/Meiotically up-regulated gene 113